MKKLEIFDYLYGGFTSTCVRLRRIKANLTIMFFRTKMLVFVVLYVYVWIKKFLICRKTTLENWIGKKHKRNILFCVYKKIRNTEPSVYTHTLTSSSSTNVLFDWYRKYLKKHYFLHIISSEYNRIVWNFYAFETSRKYARYLYSLEIDV